MAATQPRYWKQLDRHPLSAEYEDVKGPQWEALLESIKTFGFDPRKPIVLAPDEDDKGSDGKPRHKVGDGWQRQRACVELDVRPVYVQLPKGMSLEEVIRRDNDARRHESEAQAERRIARRRAAVIDAKADGKSNRVIAEEIGVSEATVRNDLAEAGAHGCAPEPDKVTGRDGKQQSAKKAPKNGKISYDDKKLLKALALVAPILDERARIIGKGRLPQEGPDFLADEKMMDRRLNKITQAKTRVERCHELMSAVLEEIKVWQS